MMKIETASLTPTGRGSQKKAIGFSNDAKAFLSAPSFSAATFRYEGGTLDLKITLHY
jgi:uncharacterized protein (DUF2141 family)